MLEERRVVDVVGGENVTPVEGSRTFVVRNVVRVGQVPLQIVALNIDLMRPGIAQVQSETVLVFQAQSRLQRVVVGVGGVVVFVDAGETRVVSVEVGVGAPGDRLALGTGKRQRIDLALDILVPASGTYVLNRGNNGIAKCGSLRWVA